MKKRVKVLFLVVLLVGIVMALYLTLENTGYITNTIATSITVLSPNGGEVWTLGSTQNVTWTANNVNTSHEFHVTIKKGTSNIGDYVTSYDNRYASIFLNPIITLLQSGGNDYKAEVRVHDSNTHQMLSSGDDSDAPFSITNDTSAPLITSLGAISLTANSFRITWSTNENSNSTVRYGRSNQLNLIAYSTAFVTSHSILLSNLSRSTIYTYAVTSCDTSSNCAESSIRYFTTAPSYCSWWRHLFHFC